MQALPAVTASMLRDQLVSFVRHHVEGAIERFFPDLKLPARFAGRRSDPAAIIDLAYVISHLNELGVERIAGRSTLDAVRTLLLQVDGPSTRTFYSYRTAESLRQFGVWRGNSLLDSLDERQRDNLAAAIDSTDVFDAEAGDLKGLPNNYWAVLARCEHARRQLGMLDDDRLLKLAMSRVEEVLFANSKGFFDDSPGLRGRFDIYSADVHLFLEPLWDHFDSDRLRRNLEAHDALLTDAAMENGGSIVWGRSTGLLSVCLTVEWMCMSAARGLSPQPARCLALACNAANHLGDWFDAGVVTAHRERSTYAYRGPQRWLQLTFDALGKIAWAAMQLEGAGSASSAKSGAMMSTTHRKVVFPPIDRWVALNDSRADAGPATNANEPGGEHDGAKAGAEGNATGSANSGAKGSAGVWLLRNAHMAFCLPFVDGPTADYAACPQSPGVFDVPVDSPMLAGVPVVDVGDQTFAATGPPAEIAKQPQQLTASWQAFTQRDWTGVKASLPGRRTVRYHADGCRLDVQETLHFDSPPDAITISIPESLTPMSVEVIASSGCRQSTLETTGLSDLRSFWAPIRRLHQIELEPATEVRCRYVIRFTPRVVQTPGDHDYNRALYEAAAPGGMIVQPRMQGRAYEETTPESLCGDAQILHVGWPEHLIGMGKADMRSHLEHCLAFVDRLGRLPTKVVWTMHNRLPHSWDPAMGGELYRAWAGIVDGVIHHSTWGMDLIRGELPYPSHAEHVVIPHGHYGRQMQGLASRRELEERFKLPPAACRIGILGRPQKEKRIGFMVDAFAACNRRDMQLFICALRSDDPLIAKVASMNDPRIRLCPHDRWQEREEITAQVAVCDCLAGAHQGASYLTSGTYADAVGMGLPMIVNDWPFFKEVLGDAGFYFDNSAAGLTQLLNDLSADRLGAGKAASRALQMPYAWSTNAVKLAALFQRIGAASPRTNRPQRIWTQTRGVTWPADLDDRII